MLCEAALRWAGVLHGSEQPHVPGGVQGGSDFGTHRAVLRDPKTFLFLQACLIHTRGASPMGTSGKQARPTR